MQLQKGDEFKARFRNH